MGNDGINYPFLYSPYRCFPCNKVHGEIELGGFKMDHKKIEL